jgi:hypothetical protein
VLDDLRAGPPPSSGEWLARLVRRIRPSRRALGKLLPPAIAGVHLFLSGLISGYYDNLSLCHHVPPITTRHSGCDGCDGCECSWALRT